MREHLKGYADRFNARALRERVLILVTAILVIAIVANVLLFAPLSSELERTASRQDEVAASLDQSRNQVRDLRAELAEDPDADIRQRIDRLRQRLEGVESSLSSKRQRLIGASEMVAVLRDLVERDSALELETVESEPARVVEEFAMDNSGQNSDSVPARVYSHGIRMVLKGRFGDAMEYLRDVEGLRWRFFWDELDIEVTDYPETRIRLRLHTLSLDEDWIGV